MSETNLALFVKKISTDTELQKQIASLHGVSRDDSLLAAVKLSEECGIPVTAEELRSLSTFATQDNEISEDELDRVTGGASFVTNLFNTAKTGVNLLNSVINGR